MDLYNHLLQYKKEGYYPMHMPGHKRNLGFVMDNPYSIDITEIEGFDNLHEAEGILLQSMEQAANVFKTKQSYFLINGSTSGILAGISACTQKGDKIMMARNSHKAVYNAVYLRELEPVYLYPSMDESSGIAGSINANEVKRILQQNEDIKLIVITSPSYEGVISDIKEIAKIAHRYKVPLLVDEAHGAHLSFHDSFPKSSIALGADIVIQSIHKTLPAFTQTAILHRNSDLVREEELKRYLSIYQTSSPSYILMAGITNCINFLEKDATIAFEEYVKNLDSFYSQVSSLESIKVWQPCLNEFCYQRDPSKIIVMSNCKELTGVKLYEILLNKYKIQVEMTSKNYVLCMTSVCDTKEGFSRLLHALYEIDEEYKAYGNLFHLEPKYIDFIQPEIRQLHSACVDAKRKQIKLMDSLNQIAAEYVYLYPPGIPILVPGEVITKEVLDSLFEYKNSGLSLRGMKDHLGNMIQIIDNDNKHS